MQGIDWTAVQPPKETPGLNHLGSYTSVVLRHFAVNEGPLNVLFKPYGEVLTLYDRDLQVMLVDHLGDHHGDSETYAKVAITEGVSGLVGVV